VRAEWQRCLLEFGGTGTARRVQGKRPQQFNNRSNSEFNDNNQRVHPRDFPCEENGFCDYHGLKGHSTESCVTRKRAEANKTKNKPQAKVAEAKDIPTAQWPDWTSTMTRGGSAYNTAAVPAIKSVPGIFIIDSGASHHMVTSSALLSDVK
jgi:hypothetical protein